MLSEAEARIPRDQEGPLFPQAWHARAFALVVALVDGGHLGWSAFQSQLAAHLREGRASAGAHSHAEINQHYFDCWLEAAEETLNSMGFVECDDVVRQIEHIRSSVAQVRNAQLMTFDAIAGGREHRLGQAETPE
jgi:nitrile hydratase accessory protein